LKKIFPISLALLILVTNLGLTINHHYCGGELAESSFAFGEETLGCGMEKKEDNCSQEDYQNTIKQKNCCKNQYVQLTLDNEFKVSNLEESEINLYFFTSFLITYFKSPITQVDEETYLTYTPPLLKLNRQILFQSFLLYS